MTRFKILSAAAILASALASPAMAQQVTNTSSDQRQANSDQTYRQHANRQNGNWQNSYNRWDERDGFRPGNFAFGVAGGTAAAMAAEPIGGDEYARRNGFVCIPGTLFRGEDGRRHLCQ
jgi:hypothetical protein